MREWFAREFFVCGMYEVGSYILMLNNTPTTSGTCAGGATGGKKLQSSSSLDENGEQVLPRVLPEINFSADEYYKIIDWSSVRITLPPILNKVTNQELSEKLSSNSLFLDWEFLKYPWHTIAVERMVKLVTEASCQVCRSDARDGFIRCTLLSRQSMPNFGTKNQFSL